MCVSVLHPKQDRCFIPRGNNSSELSHGCYPMSPPSHNLHLSLHHHLIPYLLPDGALSPPHLFSYLHGSGVTGGGGRVADGCRLVVDQHQGALLFTLSK